MFVDDPLSDLNKKTSLFLVDAPWAEPQDDGTLGAYSRSLGRTNSMVSLVLADDPWPDLTTTKFMVLAQDPCEHHWMLCFAEDPWDGRNHKGYCWCLLKTLGRKEQ